MKKRFQIVDELVNWARGRFSLTGEEKFWLLLFLVIVWTGLIGRYLYLKNQTADLLSPPPLEEQTFDGNP